MSNKNQQAEKREPTELERIKADVEELRQEFGDLAVMVIPHHLRNYCTCSKLAVTTVTGVTTVRSAEQGRIDAQVEQFHLCESCTLPEGWRESARVSLGPAERETVRLATKLGARKR